LPIELSQLHRSANLKEENVKLYDVTTVDNQYRGYKNVVFGWFLWESGELKYGSAMPST
jgi:hypothetical protein